MSNNYSTNHKENYQDDNSSFPIDLSLLTDRQRKLIESVRRDYLPQILKDKGLFNEDKTDRLIHHTEIVLKHYQRIQKIEINLIKLCESYMNEIDPYNREIIFEHIITRFGCPKILMSD